MGMRKLSSEERCRRGDGSRVLTLFEAGGLHQNAIYIYIYIYIRKLNFLRSRFGEVFGEVLERFLERFLESKSLKKHCVLQGVLIATIEKPLVF